MYHTWQRGLIEKSRFNILPVPPPSINTLASSGILSRKWDCDAKILLPNTTPAIASYTHATRSNLAGELLIAWINKSTETGKWHRPKSDSGHQQHNIFEIELLQTM